MAHNTVDTQQLVVWVNQLRYPMEQVERLSGLTRQGIWKRLKAAGQFIPRRAAGGAPSTHAAVRCAFCDRELWRRRKTILRTMRQFCGEECYYAALELSGYMPWRHGSRLARAIVAQHFPLDPDHIVHHKDGNQRNNNLNDLAVFVSNAAHMAHHRGRHVQPLWDGANV